MFIFLKKKVSWGIKLIGILFVFSLFPVMSFAGIDIVELLPNPAGDDTLGEYIEIRNTGCESVDLGGYHIFDASNRTYILPNPTIIDSHKNLRLPYSTTRIALNNSGIESIALTDSGGTLLDSYIYNGTQRDDIIIVISSTDENCEVIVPIDTSTGNILTDIGRIDSGSINAENTDTGSIITDTGLVDTISSNTGIIDTGSLIENDTGTTILPIISTGTTEGSELGISISRSINVESTNTGIIIESGSISSGVIFPDIFPTIQYPTNAIFSGEIFDCTGQLPCRINITFDSIFTGGILTKDYICEVITDSDSLTTCNPNTLYFSTGGLLVFRLTSKIDAVQSVSKSWGIIFNDSNIIDSLGIHHSGSVSDSGTENISTGITNTGVIHFEVSFPDIIPTFQNYTNTMNSGNILTCITSPCRVNFTLDPIFTGSYLAHDYDCEIQYGTGTYTSCNPAQFYLAGTGSIYITLIHKTSGQKSSKLVQIIQSTPSQNSIGNQGNMISTTDTNPPIIILEFDGKLKSYHEQIGEYEMNCYTSTCSINLSAEKSYDVEGGKLTILWYYGFNEIKTTRDPGERKYGIGDHQIWLRVIDTSGNVTSIRYYIHVLGEREENIDNTIEKKLKPKNTVIKKETKKIKKPKKPKEIAFFDPPKIVLQNSRFLEQNNGYICYTSSKECSLNFILSGSQKGIIYTWIYEDGEIIISKNPKSRSLKPGVHTIRLIAGYSKDTPLWIKNIQVTVIKSKKSKKIKKVKVSKIVQMNGSKNDIRTHKSQIYDTENEENKDNTIPYATMALLGGIMPIIILRRLFAGVIWKI